DLGAQRREQPALLLLGRAVVAQRRRDDAQALRVVRAGQAAARELLEVDHLLGRGAVPAPQLGGPAGNEPAGVEQGALPLTGPVRHPRARELRLVEALARRRVL